MVKIKIGILTKLPHQTKEEVADFIQRLHDDGFFYNKDDEKYFYRSVEDSWYLEYVTDDSTVDTTENTTTATFSPQHIIDECYEIEGILGQKVTSTAYVFVGDYEPYDNVVVNFSDEEE